MTDPAVFECPRCQRLWVGRVYERQVFEPYDWTEAEMAELRGKQQHVEYLGVSAWRFCSGIPHTVDDRPEVLAAWYLGGKAAAQALLCG